ncbi:MAG: ABC transporter permease [Microbacterium sp.]
MTTTHIIPRATGSGRQSVRAGGTILTGTVLVGVLLLTAFGPLLASWLGLDGSRTAAAPLTPPQTGLPLGSDRLGRDVLARLFNGGGLFVLVAAAATACAMLTGVTIGLLLTVAPRWTPPVRLLVDALVALPSLITAMVLLYGLGGGATVITIIVTAVSAPFVARYTRSLATLAQHTPYVEAAWLAGDGPWRIAFREILPGLAGPLTTEAGYRFVGSLYLVAATGFLGLNPLGTGGDWATMIAEGLEGIALNPWAALAPAIAIAAITLPLNLLIDRSTEECR